MDIEPQQLKHIRTLAADLQAEHRARWEQMTDAQEAVQRAHAERERLVQFARKAPPPAPIHDYSALNDYGFRVAKRADSARVAPVPSGASGLEKAERNVQTAEAALVAARATLNACTARSAPAAELAERCVAYASRHGMEV